MNREDIKKDLLKRIEESKDKDFTIKKVELGPDDPILRIINQMRRKMRRF